MQNVTPQQEDWMEKRFESFAQSQNALHRDLHAKLLLAVETQIKTTVNGKIDSIDKRMDVQDEMLKKLVADTAPLVEGKNTASSLFKFGLWASPLAIIYGALKWAKLL